MDRWKPSACFLSLLWVCSLSVFSKCAIVGWADRQVEARCLFSPAFSASSSTDPQLSFFSSSTDTQLKWKPTRHSTKLYGTLWLQFFDVEGWIMNIKWESRKKKNSVKGGGEVPPFSVNFLTSCRPLRGGGCLPPFSVKSKHIENWPNNCCF